MGIGNRILYLYLSMCQNFCLLNTRYDDIVVHIYKTKRVNYYTVYNEKNNNHIHVGLPTVVQDISNVFQHKSL